jgi:hypothetical protein
MIQPTFVFLHALGSSKGEWELVCRHLGSAPCMALDLPGFGDRVDEGYADVAAMADDLADTIRRNGLTACILVGHSMGGKIATIVAARAAAGEIGLAGVLGVALAAASPPSPEPMDEERRAQMIGWVAGGSIGQDDAETFVEANTASPLPPELHDRAVADVRRSSREAWLGWLERGSLEDWRGQVGQISIPALIVAGSEDGDLNEDAQRRLNAPHYRHADIRVVEGAAHLIPYEQPEALAQLLANHAAWLASSTLPAGFVDILGSDRVSRRTRAAMLERIRPVSDAGLPWSDAERATVQALIAHILPEDVSAHDLAQRVELAITQGSGDGWRFADLPPDPEAWRQGLLALDALTGGFAALDHNAQADWLDRIATGNDDATANAGPFSPAQMALWFQDVRAEVVRQWAALPSTMAAIGYDGFAVGGDGPRKEGYRRTGANDVEAWQTVQEKIA